MRGAPVPVDLEDIAVYLAIIQLRAALVGARDRSSIVSVPLRIEEIEVLLKRLDKSSANA